MLVSEASVEQGAQQAYLGELQKASASGKLNADPALTARIRRISDRLIPVTVTFRPDARNWKLGGQHAHHIRDERLRHAGRETHGVQRSGRETSTERRRNRRGSRA